MGNTIIRRLFIIRQKILFRELNTDVFIPVGKIFGVFVVSILLHQYRLMNSK